MTRQNQRQAKDCVERIFAGLLLAGLSPLLAAIAVAIKLDSPGPVLFRQVRAGCRGRPFELLKFRTMIVGAEHSGLRWEVRENDPRITRLGRALRRLSLDELPQLVNVTRGEMALVGPRPALIHQVERYTENQLIRLTVKPGLTGLAQVKGRNALDWDQRIELDVWYVKHWSLQLDLAILLRTPGVILSGIGIYGRDGIVRE